MLQCHFPDLEQRILEFSDPRKRKEYQISELVLGGIMMFVFKEGSRNAFDLDRKDALFRKNYERTFKMQLPSCDAIDDLLRALKTEELEQLKNHIIHSLIQKKVFHKFRFKSKYFMVSVDGTGIASYSHDYCGECTSKTSKNGKTTYYHHVLEAKLITTNDMAFSIGTEWIRNESQGEYDKQDCETKAFKRLAARIKQEFPRLPIIIVVDALYANEPFFKICREHGWVFIVTFKDGNLPSVHQEIALLPQSAKKQTERIIPQKNGSFKKQYYTYVNGIDYKGFTLSYVKCIEQIQTRQFDDDPDEEIKTFVHLSSLVADIDNYWHISYSGRLRWAIENSFDYLKNHGYNMKHKYSRVSFVALRNYYQCMMIAHMINQFVEKSCDLKHIFENDTKMTIQYLWKRLLSFVLENCVDPIEYDQLVRKRGQIRLV
ncbi:MULTISPECIES: transposase [unclassified Carboxylicivirga]|uniref:transposase n=1 Tax=Carboxylicivirga TaxID=1628153 RepID=UPI003D329B05